MSVSYIRSPSSTEKRLNGKGLLDELFGRSSIPVLTAALPE